MRRAAITVSLVGLLLLLGCAAGPNALVDTPNANGEIAGFWLGLWHGIISPLAFLGSLLSDSVQLYEVHNSGALYDFGFVLGAGILGGSGGAAARR
jgi:hypothetical protein